MFNGAIGEVGICIRNPSGRELRGYLQGLVETKKCGRGAFFFLIKRSSDKKARKLLRSQFNHGRLLSATTQDGTTYLVVFVDCNKKRIRLRVASKAERAIAATRGGAAVFYFNFLAQKFSSSAIATRSCSPVSRSRTVTVLRTPSPPSSVSKSTVTHIGVPISS